MADPVRVEGRDDLADLGDSEVAVLVAGFQSIARSSAGAVGVLQVLPATREFVEQILIGEPVPRTMDGGVRVGVAYLHHLLHLFGMDARLALGAYYSGPAAVMRRGLSRPTRRFVANVLALRGRV